MDQADNSSHDTVEKIPNPESIVTIIEGERILKKVNSQFLKPTHKINSSFLNRKRDKRNNKLILIIN